MFVPGMLCQNVRVIIIYQHHFMKDIRCLVALRIL